MCGYFCIGFIDFMLKGKNLLDCTYLFPPNKYEKNIYIYMLHKSKILSLIDFEKIEMI